MKKTTFEMNGIDFSLLPALFPSPRPPGPYLFLPHMAFMNSSQSHSVSPRSAGGLGHMQSELMVVSLSGALRQPVSFVMRYGEMKTQAA